MEIYLGQVKFIGSDCFVTVVVGDNYVETQHKLWNYTACTAKRIETVVVYNSAETVSIFEEDN